MKKEEVREKIEESISFLKDFRKKHEDKMVIRSETFVAMQEKLESIIGRAANQIMFKLGHNIGEQNFGDVKKDFMENALKKMKEIEWISRWNMKKSGKSIKISFKKTFISNFHKKTDNKTCSFISGFLTKFSEEEIGKKMVEKKCVSKGDDVCEFRTRK